MAHPNYHAQLESSAAQAQHEHATNVTMINTHCDAVKRTQDEHAARMCEELESTGEYLFKLLDEFVLPQDLVPGSGGADETDVSFTSMQVPPPHPLHRFSPSLSPLSLYADQANIYLKYLINKRMQHESARRI